MGWGRVQGVGHMTNMVVLVPRTVNVNIYSSIDKTSILLGTSLHDMNRR